MTHVYRYSCLFPACALLCVSLVSAECPEVTGSWGFSPARAIALSDGIAYVGTESQLLLLDVANPRRPALVSQMDLPSAVRDIAVQGNYVYVQTTQGLRIVDVSNRTIPTLVGSFLSWGFGGVEVLGAYAYLADGLGLRILNISNPSAPTLAGTYTAGSNAVGLALDGDFAYLSFGFQGLRVISVANPASPQLVGSYLFDTPHSASDVFVSGDHAYVRSGVGQSGDVYILDVSNPAMPVKVGFFPVTSVIDGFAVSEIGSTSRSTSTASWWPTFRIRQTPPILDGTNGPTHCN